MSPLLVGVKPGLDGLRRPNSTFLEPNNGLPGWIQVVVWDGEDCRVQFGLIFIENLDDIPIVRRIQQFKDKFKPPRLLTPDC